MVIDPRHLSSNTPPVASDRPCRKCGYNVVGLTPGAPCPECGTRIVTHREGRFADNITFAPLGYLRALSGWFGLILISGLAGTAALSSMVFAPGTWTRKLVLGAGAVWLLAVWGVTRPRGKSEGTIRDTVLDSRLLARVIVATQACWVLFGLTLLLTPALAKTSFLAAFLVELVPFVPALFGLVPLCVYLCALAEWAGDNRLASRLRLAAWGVAVCGLLSFFALFAIPGGIFGVVFVLGRFAIGGLLLSGILMLLGLAQLFAVSLWAPRNALQAMDRDTRIAEKRAQRYEQTVAQQYAAAPPAAVQTSLRPPEGDGPIPLVGDETA